MEEDALRDRIVVARSVADRVQEPGLRRVLLDGLDTALLLLQAQKRLDQATLLVRHWQTMPEHITGAAAIKSLNDVLAGGYAPGAPRPKKKAAT